MPGILFLDTNIFLHYQDFDRINWPKLVEREEVIILIPPITIRELNKHKDTSSRTRIKNRAAATLRKLSTFFENNNNERIQEGVEAHLEDRDPLIDFGSYQLSREVQDDHLIASVMMYQSETPGADVILVTSDAGLTLVAKANRLRIATKKLDDSLKLPGEPDPDQQRIKTLEEELRELKLRLPQFSLTFEDGKQHAFFNLQSPTELTQEEIEKKVSEIKQRYPRLKIIDVENKINRLVLSTRSPEDIAEYNGELDNFYNSFEEYLREEARFRDLESRTIKLAIWITNDGSAPGEDIDVFMQFPDGFMMLTENDFLSAPQPPQPPSKPKSQIEKLASFSFPTIPGLSHLTRLPQDIGAPPNISTPNIRRSNSYDVDVHVQRMKHGFREPFDAMYVTFESIESARSFHVDYKILAADLPREQSGSLHVIIKRQE